MDMGRCKLASSWLRSFLCASAIAYIPSRRLCVKLSPAIIVSTLPLLANPVPQSSRNVQGLHMKFCTVCIRLNVATGRQCGALVFRSRIDQSRRTERRVLVISTATRSYVRVGSYLLDAALSGTRRPGTETQTRIDRRTLAKRLDIGSASCPKRKHTGTKRTVGMTG